MPKIMKGGSMKKQTRLNFSEEERADPTLQKYISKSEKMADKVDNAQSKIPKKIVKRKERTFDAETGKSKVRLYFEEVDKLKPPFKLDHSVKNAPKRMMTSSIHKEISKTESDNIGVESVHAVEKGGEFTGRRSLNAYRSSKLKPYRQLAKVESKSINADVNYLYKKSVADNPNVATNPLSKWQQKLTIKNQYLANRYVKDAKATSTVTSTLKRGADAVSKSVSAIVKNPKVLLVLFVFLLVIGVVSAVVSSSSIMFQGMLSNVVATSYTSENEDIIAADNSYTALEMELQARIDNIESEHSGYDEYRYDLDPIAHDPHQLASYLTALLQYYKVNEVDDELQEVFDMQYKLTTTKVVEVRYRTEKRTGTYTDSEGNSHSYTYTVEVPYNYYILNVKLDSRSIDSIANSLLTAEQLEMYQVFLQTKGNKPLIFGGGSSDSTPSTNLNGVIFVDGERLGNQNIVDIALSQVGNIGGKPYWSWYGFDYRVEWCATYVSWVLNQAGYAEPKFAACQGQGVPFFSSQGRWANRGYSDIAPGDVIFFDWESDGHSDHVGIIVGTDGKRVYTVEGNSGDACKVRDYALNSNVIMGYGLMN